MFCGKVTTTLMTIWTIIRSLWGFSIEYISKGLLNFYILFYLCFKLFQCCFGIGVVCTVKSEQNFWKTQLQCYKGKQKKSECVAQSFISHMQRQEATWSLWWGQQRQVESSPCRLRAWAHQEKPLASREVRVPAPTHWTHLCPAAAPSRAHRGES